MAKAAVSGGGGSGVHFLPVGNFRSAPSNERTGR